ncbi:MAG: cystathionine beta-lyase [Pseudomonadota bacterium]
MSGSEKGAQSNKTRFVQMGRNHDDPPTTVNLPVMRASTVLYGTMSIMKEARARSDAGETVLRYGSRGTINAFALQDAITEIEGGVDTTLFPTGLAAIAHTFVSLLRPGDHLLLAESVYRPTRDLATDFLPQRGIECEFYTGGHEEVEKRLKPNTKMVYLDNPGSIIYDIQDIPALAKLLGGRDTLLAVDNTWGAAGLHKPLEVGADVSVIAVTKYIAGHSDLMMGAVAAAPSCAPQLRKDSNLLGLTVSPDDAYAALRGLRTAAARLAMHQAHTTEVVTWLQQHPLVEQVLYPALDSDPGHALWKRDFRGANGLFSVVFKSDVTQEQAGKFAESLELFGLGASWGGYESLVMVYPVVPGWTGNALARLHIGLEEPQDLITDLEQALAGMSS